DVTRDFSARRSLYIGRSGANVSAPDTPTGAALGVVVPCPSRPKRLSPQQYAAPPGVTPQVVPAPALTAAKVRPPDTATGVALLVVVPFPSWPESLSPQQ